jgi:hypothetical protein
MFLKEHDIHFYTNYNEKPKACIIESFNRTLKTKMWKYFTHRETLTYVSVLSEMVASYYHTVHRTIGTPPMKSCGLTKQRCSRGYMEERDPQNRANFLPRPPNLESSFHKSPKTIHCPCHSVPFARLTLQVGVVCFCRSC